MAKQKEWYNVFLIYENLNKEPVLLAKVRSYGLAYRVKQDFEKVYHVKQHIEIK